VPDTIVALDADVAHMRRAQGERCNSEGIGDPHPDLISTDTCVEDFAQRLILVVGRID
jgi:hypothetical protein